MSPKVSNAALAALATVTVVAVIYVGLKASSKSKRPSAASVTNTQKFAPPDGEKSIEPAPATKPRDQSPQQLPESSRPTTQEVKKVNHADSEDVEKKADLAQVESALGTKAYKSGSYSLAIEHFSRAIDLCPSEDFGSRKVMLNNRAASHEKLGDWSATEADATAALQIDSKYKRALIRRAKALENLGKLAESLRDLATWKALDPSNSPEEELLQVTQSMDKLAHSLAKAEADALWSKRKEERRGILDIPRAGICRQFYYAFCLDARSMRAPPSLMSLKDAIERLEKSSSTYDEQLFNVAMMHKARLELLEAKELWEETAASPKASPANRAKALSEIATLYHLSGDQITARDMLLQAQKLRETSQVWIKLAALAVEDGDFVLGKEYMERASKCISSGPDARTERADYNFHFSAIICLEAADLTVARELLDSAIADVPDYGLAYMQLGVVLFRMGQMDEALEALERACLMVPELAEVHNFHGEVLMSVDRREEASAKFLEASNADEHCALPLLNRAVLLMPNQLDQGGSEEALKSAIAMFDKAVEVDPTNEIAFIHRASYYCQIGDLRTALENYDRAIELTKSITYLAEYIAYRHLCAADLSVQELFLNLKI